MCLISSGSPTYYYVKISLFGVWRESELLILILSDLNINNFQVCLYGDKCDDMISGSTQHSTISPVPYLLANLCPPVMDVMTSIHLKVGYQIKKILYLFPKVVNCMWINHCFAKNLDSLHCNLSKCSPFFVKWRTYA